MSERYTFIDIYKKDLDLNKDKKVKVSQIVIPKIQRPYAQGRLDGVCTYVRNTLLNEMFANFKTDEIFDFNFVYGIVRPNNDEYVMELLDGQQRMTTLFLLHWYIINRELQEGDEKDTEIRDALSRFIYETRSTSTVFCQKLSSFRIDLSSTLPSKAIHKAKWYFKSFDRDSTISAMITMLDAIHERYNGQDSHELYKKLDNIQFYVKSLGYFNLSEELYIKMNARGLQLSSFENFKADLTNFISNKEFEDFKQLVPLYKKDSTDEVEFNFNFSVKLDAKWIDIFWKKGFENFDAAYMSFFSRFFAAKYIIATKDIVSDRDMRQDITLRKLYTEAEDRAEANEYLGFQEFEKLLKEHPEYIMTLDKVFDVFYEYDFKDSKKTIFKQMIPSWDKKLPEDGDDFYCNTASKMSHIKLIALSAVIEYIEAFDSFDVETFNHWMRVVWNVIENTNIDSLTPVSSLIRKFGAIIQNTAKRMKEGETFYKALSLWSDDKSDDRENRAVVEEVTKAGRIAENEQWIQIFTEAEKHPYFKGMVLFFYKDGMSIEDYIHCYNLVKDMFDANGITTSYKEDHLLIRAIASQFTTWGEMRERYITERAETNKYLKNTLASNDTIREMLYDSLLEPDEDAVKASLLTYIVNADPFEPWNGAQPEDEEHCKMAINRIRNDVKLYEWIASEESQRKNVFRVYWYEGHIMFAVPRKQFAKVALDTERAKTAYKVAETYGFEYHDANQLSMYKEYGDCFGNEIWIKQKRQKCTVWVGFCLYHELRVEIESETKKYAAELLQEFEGSKYITDDNRWVMLPALKHFTHQKTYNSVKKVIEEVFEIIPEIETII